MSVTTAKRAISLFSGAGGDTLGLERAGYQVVAYNEFNAAAIKTHQAMFPQETMKLLANPDTGATNITKVPDSVFVQYRGNVNLVFAGFPCFVAGTRVLTNVGYVPIESVSLEHTVLTHTGTFQPIVNLQHKDYTGDMYDIRIKYHPETITATANHPFLVRRYMGYHSNMFSKPVWIRADELTMSDMFGMIASESDTVTNTDSDSDSSFTDGIYVWFAPESITRKHVQTPVSVYNIEVATDNSYCVENTIVHNCQGFSHAGKKRTNDSRNELVYEFARVVNLVQPEWILGENVKGLLARKGSPRRGPEGLLGELVKGTDKQQPVIQIICELFESIGYKMTYSVVDASLLGIPQNRKRLLLVGHRGDLYPHIPWPQPQPVVCPRSFFEPHLIGAIELPQIPYAPETRDPLFWIHTTATEPTGTPHPNLVRLVQGIRNMSGKEKQNANASGGGTVVEPGGLVSFGVRKGGYHGMVLHPDKPCNTIISTYNLCPRLFVGLHNPATPDRYWVRCMTPKELGQIQGFPADYPWQGSEKEQIIQIGNAVPPKMVEVVVGLLPFAEFKEMSQVQVPLDDGSSSDSGSDSGSL